MSTVAGMIRKRVAVAVFVLVTISACDNASFIETTDEEPDQPGPVLSNISYDYDELNRLTAVRYSNGDVMRYTYDEAGNILSVEMDKAE